MAEPSSSKPKKRQLRPPKSIREQAMQNKSPEAAPKKRRISVVSVPFRLLGIPFKRADTFLGKYRFFKMVAKVLRLLSRVIFPSYIRNSFKELKLVNWPSRRESRRLTFAVIAFAVVFGALVAGLDYGLGKLFKAILLK